MRAQDPRGGACAIFSGVFKGIYILSSESVFGHFCDKRQGQIVDHNMTLGALSLGGFPQGVLCSPALKEER